MPTSLSTCGRLLAKLGLRHHVDADDGVIRLVFVTREYKNLRGEHLAIVGLETPDDGRRVRACISRAFAPGADPARTCLALCRHAAEIPLVAVEFDADQGDLRLVVETAVEDGTLSASQVAAMVDRLVEAAEAWTPLVAALGGQPPAGLSVTKRKRGAA
ncbi:hypothetical protein EBR56_00135 [bacterium]|nr:hypothetical protein [bacterium]